jgi:hypothetical protein
MTYMDVLLLIQERQEKVLAQDSTSLTTTTRHYLRVNGEWQEDPTPGAPAQRYGRSGTYWVWETLSLPDP